MSQRERPPPKSKCPGFRLEQKARTSTGFSLPTLLSPIVVCGSHGSWRTLGFDGTCLKIFASMAQFYGLSRLLKGWHPTRQRKLEDNEGEEHQQRNINSGQRPWSRIGESEASSLRSPQPRRSKLIAKCQKIQGTMPSMQRRLPRDSVR